MATLTRISGGVVTITTADGVEHRLDNGLELVGLDIEGPIVIEADGDAAVALRGLGYPERSYPSVSFDVERFEFHPEALTELQLDSLRQQRAQRKRQRRRLRNLRNQARQR